MSKTTDLIRQHFDALRAKRETILAQSVPLREKRDTIMNEARAQADVLNKQIKEIEKDLFETDTDIARLAQALGGKRVSDSVA